MCSYFIRHFSPLGIAQASLALLSLIEKVRSFGVLTEQKIQTASECRIFMDRLLPWFVENIL